MSVSLESWEVIPKLLNSIYDPNIPINFCDQHIDSIFTLLTYLIKDQIEITFNVTNIVLCEPIYEDNCIIYLSRPLIADLITKPVNFIHHDETDVISKINIFQGLNVESFKNQNPNNNDYDDEFGSNDSYDSDVDDDYYKYKKNTVRCDSKRLKSLANFEYNNSIRYIQALRIIFMVEHFYQHYIKRIPYNDHKNFTRLEHAVRKKPQNDK